MNYYMNYNLNYNKYEHSEDLYEFIHKKYTYMIHNINN